jgi:hypothetical protein
MSDTVAIVWVMASKALVRWRTERAVRLDDLIASHRLVRVPAKGRYRRAAALNQALVVSLAAEFQGFARDLHDEACVVFAHWSVPSNREAYEVIRSRLRQGRELDRGNAHPGSLGSDFGRVGIDLWPMLEARDPHTRRHNRSLDRLNAARNAIAHSDGNKLALLRSSGLPLVATTLRRWRADIDTLAINMDRAVAARLGSMFGRPEPW